MTRTARRLQETLMQHPAEASYASISDISARADLHMAAVTRTAQRWGFTGWPDLRVELRSRYLESLSFSEVASHRRSGSAASQTGGSMDADRRALVTTSSSVDAGTVRAVAEVAARARRRVALGAGTYRAPADLLALYFTLAGYPATSPGDSGGVVGALTDIGEGDLVIGFDLWRGYAATRNALAVARDSGAVVCLVTDRGTHHLGETADHVFHVSSESSSFFPTLVPAVALVNALAAELAALDQAVADDSSKRFEKIWRRMGFDGQR